MRGAKRRLLRNTSAVAAHPLPPGGFRIYRMIYRRSTFSILAAPFPAAGQVILPARRQYICVYFTNIFIIHHALRYRATSTHFGDEISASRPIQIGLDGIS